MKWLTNNLDEVLSLLLSHLAVALPAILISLVISVPLGWLAHRARGARGVILTVATLTYAIPSLALFVALPAFTGASIRSPINLVVALTIYGVAVIVRTAADAFDAVSGDVRQAAVAVGYAQIGRFWRVDLPLAGPVILAGLRVVTVSTISLATVGSVIGVPTLGSLFTDGFQRGIQAEIITGIVVTTALAIGLDRLVVLGGRAVMPWTRPSAKAGAGGPDAASTAHERASA